MVARAEKEPRLAEAPPSGPLFKQCQHSWVGLYEADDSVEMSGAECYVEFDNKRLTKMHAVALPTLTFKHSQ